MRGLRADAALHGRPWSVDAAHCHDRARSRLENMLRIVDQVRAALAPPIGIASGNGATHRRLQLTVLRGVSEADGRCFFPTVESESIDVGNVKEPRLRVPKLARLRAIISA